MVNFKIFLLHTFDVCIESFIVLHCIVCRLVGYESAIAYQDRRRNIAPGLNNARRLIEKPIPNTDLIQDQTHVDEQSTEKEPNDVLESSDGSYGLSALFANDGNAEEEGFEDEHGASVENESIQIENVTCAVDSYDSDETIFDENIDSYDCDETIFDGDENPKGEDNVAEITDVSGNHDNGNTMHMLEVEPEVLIDINPVIKQEIDPLQDYSVFPDDALAVLLAENETVEIDDDISMVIGFEGIPAPFVANVDNMIKREDDPISNNIPFNLTVSIFQCVCKLLKLKAYFFQKKFGRSYKVGEKMVIFPKKMVLQLTNWMRHPKRDSVHHDKRFVHAVLHVCAKDRLAKGEIRPEEMLFVRREYFDI